MCATASELYERGGLGMIHAGDSDAFFQRGTERGDGAVEISLRALSGDLRITRPSSRLSREALVIS